MAKLPLLAIFVILYGIIGFFGNNYFYVVPALAWLFNPALRIVVAFVPAYGLALPVWNAIMAIAFYGYPVLFLLLGVLLAYRRRKDLGKLKAPAVILSVASIITLLLIAGVIISNPSALSISALSPPQSSLTVDSVPITNINITVDGANYTTNTPPIPLLSGLHVVVVPRFVGYYAFVRWEDGSLNTTRTVNLTVNNATITAFYAMHMP